ncbi:hypothetical protein [Pseudomonas capsici]|uniref:hypothetical protein n=1 Tax=Pseudomonas capsici TaxID=2810614 RepID=UPI0021F1B101|nr:hypothetical protein [Pseudomonas capsici]MCV4285056.1 hypothetical protein [Pseudomonas capsici]
MTDLDLERYQDSYQGMGSVRRSERRLDQYGNPIRPITDFCHNYDNPIDLAARREREAAERKSLARRIGIAMTQMERICPPKGNEA